MSVFGVKKNFLEATNYFLSDLKKNFLNNYHDFFSYTFNAPSTNRID